MLTELVFPCHCPLCGIDTLRGLCERCQQLLGDGGISRCLRCGQPIGPYVPADANGGCGLCSRRRMVTNRVESLGLYVGTLREACILGKEAGAEPLVKGLGECFWESRGEALERLGIDVVVPVPQHWTKRIVSGHNQAETLATVLAHCLNVPLGRNILRKTRRTPDQSSLKAVARRANLRGAFGLKSSCKLIGQHVLLVDDVMTTGTTIQQAAGSLMRGRAGKVSVAVLAVVPASVDRFPTVTSLTQ
tara:strand:- start:27 stop:767 length:741 start_codon:yes stop_codon:yes gene_type:complete